jgi:hypothetical protein
MTLYDELFEIHDSLVANDKERTLEAYCSQSVFYDKAVEEELERLCEEGEFFKRGNEYRVF